MTEPEVAYSSVFMCDPKNPDHRSAIPNFRIVDPGWRPFFQLPGLETPIHDPSQKKFPPVKMHIHLSTNLSKN